MIKRHSLSWLTFSVLICFMYFFPAPPQQQFSQTFFNNIKLCRNDCDCTPVRVYCTICKAFLKKSKYFIPKYKAHTAFLRKQQGCKIPTESSDSLKHEFTVTQLEAQKCFVCRTPLRKKHSSSSVKNINFWLLMKGLFAFLSQILVQTFK